MNVNLRSVFNLMQLATPMILTKGNIVNISSVTGLRSFRACWPTAFQGGVDQLTAALHSVGSQRCTRNAVNPGVVVKFTNAAAW